MFFLLCSFYFISCENENEKSTICPQSMYISIADFDNGPLENSARINYIEYNEGCLLLNVSFSGCGEQEMDVISDGKSAIIETDECQEVLSFRFALLHNNPDDCEAYITQDLEVGIEELFLIDDLCEIHLSDRDTDNFIQIIL